MPDLPEIDGHAICTFDPLAPDDQLKRAVAVLQEHVVDRGRLVRESSSRVCPALRSVPLSARIVVRLWR